MATFSYASAFDSSQNPLNLSASSSSAASGGTDHDDVHDGCSICLEPFGSHDPASVTSCKHEYHLQCILEWSQRSKECPICWQLFVLEDSASQELLAAVTKERCSRVRNIERAPSRIVYQLPEDFGTEEGASHEAGSEGHIMHGLAAAASKACLLRRRERLRSSGRGPSGAIVIPPMDNVNANQTFDAPLEGCRNTLNRSSNGMPSPVSPVSCEPPSVMSDDSSRDGRRRSRAFFGPSSNRTERFSLPDSFKSKLTSASARYKESLSKSTKTLKEKLLVHNDSIKELSKGVQREMTAGIAGVTRIFERIDLASRRPGNVVPCSVSTGGSSESPVKGKHVEENATGQTLSNTKSENMFQVSSAPAEVPLAQGGNRC